MHVVVPRSCTRWLESVRRFVAPAWPGPAVRRAVPGPVGFAALASTTPSREPCDCELISRGPANRQRGGAVFRIVVGSAVILVCVGAVAGPRALAGSRSSGVARPPDDDHALRYAPVRRARDRAGAGRRPVVHQPGNARSGGSRPAGRSRTTPTPASASRAGSRRGRTAPLWFTEPAATTRSGGSRPAGRSPTSPRRHQRPAGSRRARTARLVHQPRQQLDRADHHRGDGHQLHRRRSRLPVGITAGPDGALWFTNQSATTRSGGSPPPGRSPTSPAPASTARRRSRPGPTARCGSPTTGNDSIGRITTGGDGHQLHRRRHQTARAGSRPGPDGALWFTNYGGTTRSGGSPPRDGHQLHRHRHQLPGRGSRPGPTAPCGSPTSGNDSIGRITTAGDGHQLHRRRHQHAARDHGRAGRRAVVHQRRQRLDRADHHRRDGHHLHRTPASAARAGSRPGRTARCGSPTSATTRSGGSPPRATSPTTPTRHQRPERDRGRARRRALVHQPRQRLDRADHHRRHGHQLHRHRASTTRAGSRRGPTARSGSPTRARLDRADHHRRARQQLHRPRHPQPAGSRPGPTARLVHQPRQRLDRADHHRRHVSNYTTRASAYPYGIAAGPDGNALVHQPRRRLDRADHHQRQRSRNYTDPSITTRWGSWRGRTALSGSPTTATTRSGARRSSRAADAAARPPRRGTPVPTAAEPPAALPHRPERTSVL